MSDFKLTPRPEDASDSLIAKLFDDDFQIAKATNAAFDRLEQAMHKPPEMTPELFFSGNTQRRRMVYDRVPVGHDTGYRCYDGMKHDAESAFTSGEYGDGLTENEAYVDWLRNVDDIKSSTVVYPKIFGGSSTEPADYGAPRRVPDPDEEP